MNETISKSEMKQNKIKLDENLNHWKYSRMNKQYDKQAYASDGHDIDNACQIRWQPSCGQPRVQPCACTETDGIRK